MSDSKQNSDNNDNEENKNGLLPEDNFYDKDLSNDDIDEELMALAPPPPAIQEAIFIMVILGFSIFILYLFFPQAKYFVKAFSKPENLGDAANINTAKLAGDSYVRVEGMPLVNRTVTFSTGTKWFSGDIYRKMAPVGGNSSLLAQWHTPNPNIKQEKDILTPPSDFAGRLKKREELSKNYNKFWPFFDCLNFHDTSQCKFCIGKKSLDDCRPVFTCVDNYPIELCDITAFNSKEEIETRIAKLDEQLNTSKNDSIVTEIASYKVALNAVENIELLTQQVKLEEYFTRLERLAAYNKGNKDIEALQLEILDKMTDELSVLFIEPNNKLKSLSKPIREKLENAIHNMDEANEKLKIISIEKKKLGPLVDVNRELADFIVVIDETISKLKLGKDVDSLISGWKLNNDASGDEIYNKVLTLNASVIKSINLIKDNESNVNTDQVDKDKESDEKINEPDSDNIKDSDIRSAEAIDKTQGDAEVADSDIAQLSSEAQRVIDNLFTLRNRLTTLGRKINTLNPGDSKELDKWADKTDIVGSLPKALRAQRVITSVQKIEGFVKDTKESTDISLKQRYKKLLADEKENREKVKTTGLLSGVEEFKIIKDFENLKSKKERFIEGRDFSEYSKRLFSLFEIYKSKDFYPADLGNHAEVKSSLIKFFKNCKMDQYDTKISSLEMKIGRPVFVLLDGEKPGDNLWILFVYLIIPVLMFVNIRRLLRFIRFWSK
ncbi:MAG: hypothetical protein JXR91_00285 [Deltaproteobacteria bacterium]|nr:hypothetical protein [Deltaproteobacteria bacterium]